MKRILYSGLLVLWAVPAFAQAAAVMDDKATIAKVESYFNGVTTVRARFTQANQDGTVQGGVFTWWRPGRLRFQYDPPNGDYIVADGLLLHYWDDAVKNYSNTPIGTTLADFLLRKKIKLSGDLKVVSIRRPAKNKLLVTLVQTSNPEAGDLRLMFAENPMQLLKWRVTDGAGQITEVTLTNIEPGVGLDPRSFRFKPPKGYDKDWKDR